MLLGSVSPAVPLAPARPRRIPPACLAPLPPQGSGLRKPPFVPQGAFELSPAPAARFAPRYRPPPSLALVAGRRLRKDGGSRAAALRLGFLPMGGSLRPAHPALKPVAAPSRAKTLASAPPRRMSACLSVSVWFGYVRRPPRWRLSGRGFFFARGRTARPVARLRTLVDGPAGRRQAV